MTSFYEKLQSIARRYPGEARGIERLAAEFDRALASHGARSEFTLARLAEIASPQSTLAFARILGECVRAGILEARYRVLSDNGKGLGDFKTLKEVPPEIRDWRNGLAHKSIVKPDDIQVIYRFTPRTLSGGNDYAN